MTAVDTNPKRKKVERNEPLKADAEFAEIPSACTPTLQPNGNRSIPNGQPQYY